MPTIIPASPWLAMPIFGPRPTSWHDGRMPSVQLTTLETGGSRVAAILVLCLSPAACHTFQFKYPGITHLDIQFPLLTYHPSYDFIACSRAFPLGRSTAITFLRPFKTPPSFDTNSRAIDFSPTTNYQLSTKYQIESIRIYPNQQIFNYKITPQR